MDEVNPLEIFASSAFIDHEKHRKMKQAAPAIPMKILAFLVNRGVLIHQPIPTISKELTGYTRMSNP
jgi:hypothetical protein